MIATLSDLQIASAELEKYVDMRRMHINRALAEQPGFEGSVLLRARERKAAGEENLALFNFWDSAADADAWKSGAPARRGGRVRDTAGQIDHHQQL